MLILLPVTLVLILLMFIILALAGRFPRIDKRKQKDRISMYPQADQNILLYLKENYPNHEFDLIVDYSMGRPVLSYHATEKSGKYITASIHYNMESGKIITDVIPAVLIANQFEGFISNKLGEAFPNSKVYMDRNGYSWDNWRSWDLYEFNLENYLEYHVAVDTWTKGASSGPNRSDKKFFVVMDSKNFSDRLKHIKAFFSYSEDYKYKYNYHYIEIKLLYVPTEYFNQTDNYFIRSSFGDRFNADTDFYNSIISNEIIAVNTYRVELYSNKQFGKIIEIID